MSVSILRDLYRRYGEDLWRDKNEDNLGNAMTGAFAAFARDDALHAEVKQQSSGAFRQSQAIPPSARERALHTQADRQ